MKTETTTNPESLPARQSGSRIPNGPGRRKKSFLPMMLTFIVSMPTWLVLSGKFDAFHITLGMVSCAIVAYVSGDLLFRTVPDRQAPQKIIRFILYVPWLLYEVFAANLHILKLVFDPKMMEKIDPRIVKFKSRLSGRMPLFIFGNSITLTPGTVTIFVNVFGTFTVHAIDRSSAEALPGEMENKIAGIFNQ